jgi:FkbM family methyltransferase
MLKIFIKKILQKILGLNNYLFVFSIFTITKMRWHKHEKEFAAFTHLLPNEGAMLDIGANIGVMTATLAQKFTAATIFAFEPMPQNKKALDRVIKYFKLLNVRVFNIALGNEAGKLTMVMPLVNNVAMQGLSHVVETTNENTAAEGMVFTVPVLKLDDIPELQNLEKITAVKIDVENFEYPVLMGAQQLLEKHKPIIYAELWKNERRTLTLDYLKSLGYTVSVYNGRALEIFAEQEATNFIFRVLQ